jgi:hypothetical protein
MDLIRRLSIRHFAEIDKTVEGTDKPPPDCAPIVLVEGIANDLEASAVVLLDHSGDQGSYRMSVKIR